MITPHTKDTLALWAAVSRPCKRLVTLSILNHLHGLSIWTFQLKGKWEGSIIHNILGVALPTLSNNCITTVLALHRLMLCQRQYICFHLISSFDLPGGILRLPKMICHSLFFFFFFCNDGGMIKFIFSSPNVPTLCAPGGEDMWRCVSF